jgi:hypothetical protein
MVDRLAALLGQLIVDTLRLFRESARSAAGSPKTGAEHRINAETRWSNTYQPSTIN